MSKIINLIILNIIFFNKVYSNNLITFNILKENGKNIAVIFQCKSYNQNSNLDQRIDDFNHSVFDFKEVLDFADLNKLSLILFSDDNFENKSTICDQSPWTESARVAFAWASTYFRFKKLNIFIIKVPFRTNINLKLYKNKFSSLIKNQFEENGKTIEELMEQRFINYEKFKKINSDRNDVSIEEFSIKRKIEKNNSLKINLPDLNINQKRFLISGGAGFIGINLIKKLLEMGHQVICIDNFLCCSKNNLNSVKDNLNFCFINFDVCKPFNIDCDIDEVIHLASVPSPEFYYNLPEETLETGLFGTKNMLELAKNKNAGFLFSSTSEVYGDPNISPQPEIYEGNVSPIGKRSQYDQSKRGGETLCMLYFKKYNFEIKIGRFLILYGDLLHYNM